MPESAKVIGGTAANQRGLAVRSFLPNQIIQNNPAERLFVRYYDGLFDNYDNYDN